jgi:hypothetical protein
MRAPATLTLVGALCLAGCAGTATSQTGDAPSSNAVLSFDRETGVITIDPAINKKDKRRFDFGFGSVTVETFGHSNSEFAFEYTKEIEGGYTVYRCTAPIAAPAITIEIPKGGGTQPKTSFDLKKCKVVRSGNLLLERSQPPQK